MNGNFRRIIFSGPARRLPFQPTAHIDCGKRDHYVTEQINPWTLLIEMTSNLIDP